MDLFSGPGFTLGDWLEMLKEFQTECDGEHHSIGLRAGLVDQTEYDIVYSVLDKKGVRHQQRLAVSKRTLPTLTAEYLTAQHRHIIELLASKV